MTDRQTQTDKETKSEIKTERGRDRARQSKTDRDRKGVTGERRVRQGVGVCGV